MKSIVANKLAVGDEIRVISPSSSIVRVSGFEENLRSKVRLEELGFVVTFGEHILENDCLFSSSISSRVADLHAAFADKKVKAILTTIGGNNCNELLPAIDWELIAKNPKRFIGYSDTTSLHNAIRAKTGLVTYYGPCYSAFRMNDLQVFQSREWFKAMTQDNYKLEASDVWTSDPWYDESLPRYPMKNEWKIYQHGNASGIITGGNCQTYYLQAGTEYFPKVSSPILFIEQAEGGTAIEFSRELAHILQLHPDIAGLVIGRFPKENHISPQEFVYVLDKYPLLKTIPVIYDIDFGHTQPMFTFPLGGQVELSTAPLQIRIF